MISNYVIETAVDLINDYGLDYKTRFDMAKALAYANECLALVRKYKGRENELANNPCDRENFEFYSTSVTFYANQIGLPEEEIFKVVLGM